MMQIPLRFILENAKLDWQDWAWGYMHDYLTWQNLVKVACDEVMNGNEDQNIFSLACVLESDTFRIKEILGSITDKKPSYKSNSKQKWLYLILGWLYENHLKYEDPLGKVEEVYANFNYPNDMVSFVRYMPCGNKYDPNKYSKIQNTNRLLSNWKKYLTEKRYIYNS